MYFITNIKAIARAGKQCFTSLFFKWKWNKNKARIVECSFSNVLIFDFQHYTWCGPISYTTKEVLEFVVLLELLVKIHLQVLFCWECITENNVSIISIICFLDSLNTHFSNETLHQDSHEKTYRKDIFSHHLNNFFFRKLLLHLFSLFFCLARIHRYYFLLNSGYLKNCLRSTFCSYTLSHTSKSRIRNVFQFNSYPVESVIGRFNV